MIEKNQKVEEKEKKNPITQPRTCVTTVHPIIPLSIPLFLAFNVTCRGRESSLQTPCLKLPAIIHPIC